MKATIPKENRSTLEKKYIQLKWKEKYLEIINDFALFLMKLDSIDEVVWGIAKQVIAKMEFEDCVIYLYDKDNKVLVQKAAHGPKNPEKLDIKNPITIELGKGIVGAVAKNEQPEIINDTRLDNRYILDDRKRLSEIAVPIIYEKELIGVIDSENSEMGFFTQEHLRILTTIAAISANKIKHAQANEKLKNYQKDLENEVALKTKNLRNAIDQLKRSNQDLESFAYAASHDLQEPLRTVISYIQLIQRKEQNLSSESKEYINYVVGGAKRMKSLLQGLLEYSRLNHFHHEEMVELEMQDLMLLVRANLNSSLDQNLAEIQLRHLHPVKGNKTQLIQLFQNIISNALKFKTADTKPIIQISSQEVDAFIEFRIKDNGIGIPKEFKEKVFTLFSRLNPIGTFEGSGIGLALCKRIMEYHQGEIFIESEVGQGTTFVIRFPAN